MLLTAIHYLVFTSRFHAQGARYKIGFSCYHYRDVTDDDVGHDVTGTDPGRTLREPSQRSGSCSWRRRSASPSRGVLDTTIACVRTFSSSASRVTSSSWRGCDVTSSCRWTVTGASTAALGPVTSDVAGDVVCTCCWGWCLSWRSDDVSVRWLRESPTRRLRRLLFLLKHATSKRY